MRYFRIPNLAKYQHYSDRSPPWIKLHGKVLMDYEFSRLRDASKAHLMLIWLLASRLQNAIPYDPGWIAQKIGANAPVDLEELESLGFIEVFEAASKALPERLQNGVLETETEVEKGTKPKPVAGGRKRTPPAPPKSGPTWDAYSTAYVERYGTPPVRNAKINAQLGKLVDRLGADDAPQVAAFYLRHQNHYYVQRGHAVDALLADAEKLRTEWATNRPIGNVPPRTDANRAGALEAMRIQRERSQQQAAPAAPQLPAKEDP